MLKLHILLLDQTVKTLDGEEWADKCIGLKANLPKTISSLITGKFLASASGIIFQSNMVIAAYIDNFIVVREQVIEPIQVSFFLP